MKSLSVVGVSLLVSLAVSIAKPLVVAHRGASHDAPENTLPAFELAWTQGADAIEGDFLLTKDNRIVCIHDGSTKRLTDRNLVVRGSTLKELRELDVGYWKHEKFKGTKIPTIAEVFATIPKGMKIFVEVKCGKEIIPYSSKPCPSTRPIGCPVSRRTRRELGNQLLRPSWRPSRTSRRMALIRTRTFLARSPRRS